MLCAASAKARSSSLPAPSSSHDVRLWVAQHSKLGAVAAALEPEAAQLGIQVSKSGGGAGQEVQAEHLAVQLGREGTEQGYVSAEAVPYPARRVATGGLRREAADGVGAAWHGSHPLASRDQSGVEAWWPSARPLHSRFILRRETLQLLLLTAGSLGLQAAAGACPVLLGGNDVYQARVAKRAPRARPAKPFVSRFQLLGHGDGRMRSGAAGTALG